MLGTIRHESLYTTGTWIDESLGVYVAWALHRGSFCEGMPLINERGDLVLVFSGEDTRIRESWRGCGGKGTNWTRTQPHTSCTSARPTPRSRLA